MLTGVVVLGVVGGGGVGVVLGVVGGDGGGAVVGVGWTVVVGAGGAAVVLTGGGAVITFGLAAIRKELNGKKKSIRSTSVVLMCILMWISPKELTFFRNF